MTISRRDFLKTSVEVGKGAVLSAALPGLGLIQQDPYRKYVPDSFVVRVAEFIKNNPPFDSKQTLINGGPASFMTYPQSEYINGMMYEVKYIEAGYVVDLGDKVVDFLAWNECQLFL